MNCQEKPGFLKDQSSRYQTFWVLEEARVGPSNLSQELALEVMVIERDRVQSLAKV
jgi:hypothetical protein